MKSVCPMVCQKNENVLYTPCKTVNKTCTHPQQTQHTLNNHCFKPLTKPCKPVPNPPVPLEGLTFSALKQKQAG